jgi:ParB/RepB/Spo0J family partition protein
MGKSKSTNGKPTLMRVRLDRCVALKRNPQYLTPHEMEALKRSIERDGFLAPILVRPLRDGRRFEIVSGNHRAMAARELGHETVPAVIAPIDDRAAKRIAINLNTVHGTPSAELMAPFLAELDDELLRQVHIDDALLADVMRFDSTLQQRLAQLEPPDALNHGSPQVGPDCVCPNCGRRHAHQ